MSSEAVSLDYYKEKVDFNQLAKDDEEFGNLFRASDGTLNWQDPVVVRVLNKALLKRDFGLTLTLPDDRLCPPVPVRYNYVRWIQELIDTTGEKLNDKYDLHRLVTGLDIGTGSSCIYALLACATRKNWNMLGTDIDSHSLRYASQNVADNNMSERIKLLYTTSDSPLVALDDAGVEKVDFVLCNPPFYSSEDDMDSAYAGKALPPSAVCTGSVTEMIAPGGDIGFALRIFEESLELGNRVQWYSCMLSRLASAQELVVKLKEHGITNFAATNLKAGRKTVRWAVAWSFDNYRPMNDAARHGSLCLALLPPSNERTIVVPVMTAQMLEVKLNDLLDNLDLDWEVDRETATGVVKATGNVWSRSARRKRSRQQGLPEEDGNPPALVSMAAKIVYSDERLDVRWLQGCDAVLFESFIGMLKTSLGVRIGIH